MFGGLNAQRNRPYCALFWSFLCLTIIILYLCQQKQVSVCQENKERRVEQEYIM